jgi:hypothetical protein
LAKLTQTGAWIQIQTVSGRRGFMPAAHLAKIQPPAKRRARGVEGASSAAAGANDIPQIEPDERPLVTVINDPDVILVGGLRLRASVPGGTVLRQMPPGTSLYVREPRNVADAKIGVYGEWLSVCTMDGVAGFSAAWYVQKLLGWG